MRKSERINKALQQNAADKRDAQQRAKPEAAEKKRQADQRAAARQSAPADERKAAQQRAARRAKRGQGSGSRSAEGSLRPKGTASERRSEAATLARLAQTEKHSRREAFAARGKTRKVCARLIVRRVRDANPHHVIVDAQGELFRVWRHHAVFTDSPLPMLDAERDHRRHAIIEQVIADLKNSALAHLPSGHFAANSAWLVLAAMAFNLTRADGPLASTFTGVLVPGMAGVCEWRVGEVHLRHMISCCGSALDQAAQIPRGGRQAGEHHAWIDRRDELQVRRADTRSGSFDEAPHADGSTEARTA